MPNEAATLDNRSIDPTVNLSVDKYDNSGTTSAIDNFPQVRSCDSSMPPPTSHDVHPSVATDGLAEFLTSNAETAVQKCSEDGI